MGSKYWKRLKLSTGHGAVNRRGFYRQSRPFCLIFRTYAPAHTRHPRDLGGLRRPAGACRPVIPPVWPISPSTPTDGDYFRDSADARGRPVASGVYLFRLTTPTTTHTTKALLLK